MIRAALALLLLAWPATAANNPMATSRVCGLRPGVYYVTVGSGLPRFYGIAGSILTLRTAVPATVRVRMVWPV